jgi:hypothetical protein
MIPSNCNGVLIGEDIFGWRFSASTPGGYETLDSHGSSIGVMTSQDPRIFLHVSLI